MAINRTNSYAQFLDDLKKLGEGHKYLGAIKYPIVNNALVPKEIEMDDCSRMKRELVKIGDLFKVDIWTVRDADGRKSKFASHHALNHRINDCYYVSGWTIVNVTRTGKLKFMAIKMETLV